ncbi:MAG: FtsX-like permease family protein [Pseudomonadota bacterium]
MKYLLRFIGRNALKIKYRIIAISIITASSVGLLVGSYSSIESLFFTVNNIYKSSNVADLEVRVAAEDQINFPSFQDIGNISNIEKRLILPGKIIKNNKEVLSSVVIANQLSVNSGINKTSLLKGNPLQANDTNGVLLERNCAKYHNYQVGDIIKVGIGDGVYEVFVRGVILSPEYLISPVNPGIFVPTNGSLCVIYGNVDLFWEKIGFNMLNSILFTFDSKVSSDLIKNNIEDRALTRLHVDYSVKQVDNYSYKFLEMDLDTFKVFLPAIVFVFMMSAIIIIFFIMFQWISSEKNLIGMLMALGYKKYKISFGYLFPVFFIILLSGAIGYLFSHFILHIFGKNYALAIGMPEPDLKLFYNYFMWGASLLLTVTVSSVIWPQVWLLKLTPLEAIRSSSVNTTKSFQKIISITRKISGPIYFRYALRSILRNIKISIVTVLSIALCLGTIISFFVSLTSMEKTAINHFKNDSWVAIVDLFSPLWNDELEEFYEIAPKEKWAPYVKGYAQITQNNLSKNIYIVGTDPKKEVRNVSVLHGRKILPTDENVILLEYKTARDLGFRVGDKILIKANNITEGVELIGIISGAVPGEAYSTSSFVEKLFDLQDRVTGMFLLGNELSDLQKSNLYNNNNVISITTIDDIVGAILSISSQIWVILKASSVLSIGVAVLFVLISMTFSLLKRISDFGMLKVVGFSDFLLIKMIVVEALILGIVAIILAIPIGYGLAYYLNGELTDAWFKVYTYATFKDFFTILFPALIFIPIATIIPSYIILRTKLVKIINERKFG